MDGLDTVGRAPLLTDSGATDRQEKKLEMKAQSEERVGWLV